MASDIRFDSKVQAKGEIQIPEGIREHLKLEVSDRLLWFIGTLGTAYVAKGKVVEAGKGARPTPHLQDPHSVDPHFLRRRGRKRQPSTSQRTERRPGRKGRRSVRRSLRDLPPSNRGPESGGKEGRLLDVRKIRRPPPRR